MVHAFDAAITHSLALFHLYTNTQGCQKIIITTSSMTRGRSLTHRLDGFDAWSIGIPRIVSKTPNYPHNENIQMP